MLSISLGGSVNEQLDLIADLIQLQNPPGSVLFTTPTNKTNTRLLTLFHRRYPEAFQIADFKHEPFEKQASVTGGLLFGKRFYVHPNEKWKRSRYSFRSCCFAMAVVLMSEDTCPEAMANLHAACHHGRMVLMSWEPGVL